MSKLPNPHQREAVQHWAGHAVALFVTALRWLHCPTDYVTLADVAFNIETADRAADIGLDALNGTGDYARMGATACPCHRMVWSRVNAMRQRLARADYAACLAVADARKAENAAARTRMQANPELVDELQSQAARRGETQIDWPEYFRNAGVFS